MIRNSLAKEIARETAICDRMKTKAALTKAQIAWLEKACKAHKGPGGEFTNPYVGGFESVTWRRMAQRLTERGIIRAYTFGGFHITDLGHAELAKARAQ